MEGKAQNRIQEVSADEIGRQIQAVVIYGGISPTGSNTTNGDHSQNSWGAGGDPLGNPSVKKRVEWDFAPYKDIVPGASSQRK